MVRLPARRPSGRGHGGDHNRGNARRRALPSADVHRLAGGAPNSVAAASGDALAEDPARVYGCAHATAAAIVSVNADATDHAHVNADASGHAHVDGRAVVAVHVDVSVLAHADGLAIANVDRIAIVCAGGFDTDRA
jgi:hypothetical protein